MDSHTDELIQRVMKERFANHTVLSVVHKLESALDDFDMVIVLDAGELKEVGPPRELLAKSSEGSAFAALYERLASNKSNPGDKDEIMHSVDIGEHSLTSESKR